MASHALCQMSTRWRGVDAKASTQAVSHTHMHTQHAASVAMTRGWQRSRSEHVWTGVDWFGQVWADASPTWLSMRNDGVVMPSSSACAQRGEAAPCRCSTAEAQLLRSCGRAA
eukprot:363936-Chlamydomonas_euryale.AAC.7